MAQQATVKRASKVGENTANRGRPVGARNLTPEQRAEKKRKVFDYSRFKITFQKPADFYAYLEGYPDKTGLLGFVYRLKPRIDLSLIGIAETSIFQTSIASELTEEHIGETFGRGLYMVKLNDANRLKGQTECCRTWFDIADVEKAPQYDPRTLCLGDSKNLDEITRLINGGVLVRDSTGAPRLRNENDPAPVAPAAQSNPGHGSELFGRDVVGQIVLAALNRGTQSPHDAVKDTIEVARLLAPAQPAMDLEAVIDRVVARLGAAPREDAFATYERIDAFVSKVRGPVSSVVGAVAGDAAGAAAGDAASAWAPHLGGIIAQVRALVPEVLGAYQLMRRESGDGAPLAQNERVVKVLTVEQKIEEVFRIGFQRMQEGVTGFDFAAWVCFHYPGGLQVYKSLEPAGALGLIALAAMNPQARALVNDPQIRPQLETFLTDFFSFDPSGGSGAPGPVPSSGAS